MSEAPLITVGMPVFNEMEYIEETLTAVLSQSHSNLEIVIADNASDDGTYEYLQTAAEKDPRITLIRQDKNRGSVVNGNTVIQSARGEYFIFASGHDVWPKKFIDKLLSGLLDSPKCILAYPTFKRIDQTGSEIEWRKARNHQDTSKMADPIRRFNTYLWCDQWPVYGLISSAALQKTRRPRNVIAPGVILMCELAIIGRFVHIPSVSMHARQTREKETANERKKRYNSSVLKHKQRFLPYWRIPFSLFISCLRTPIKHKRPLETRLFLIISSINSFAKFHRYLVRDIANLCSRK